MPLLEILIALVIFGFAFWLLDFIPMDGTFKAIIKGVVVLLLILWLISVLFGVSTFPLRLR